MKHRTPGGSRRTINQSQTAGNTGAKTDLTTETRNRKSRSRLEGGPLSQH